MRSAEVSKRIINMHLSPLDLLSIFLFECSICFCCPFLSFFCVFSFIWLMIVIIITLGPKRRHFSILSSSTGPVEDRQRMIIIVIIRKWVLDIVFEISVRWKKNKKLNSRFLKRMLFYIPIPLPCAWLGLSETENIFVVMLMLLERGEMCTLWSGWCRW